MRGAIVEKVGARAILQRGLDIGQTPVGAGHDLFVRNVVAANRHPVGDAGKIDGDVLIGHKVEIGPKAVFAGGLVDKACLNTFGLVNTAGTSAQRSAMRSEKLLAIKTTILDWLRKLKTGDLL